MRGVILPATSVHNINMLSTSYTESASPSHSLQALSAISPASSELHGLDGWGWRAAQIWHMIDQDTRYHCWLPHSHWRKDILITPLAKRIDIHEVTQPQKCGLWPGRHNIEYGKMIRGTVSETSADYSSLRLWTLPTPCQMVRRIQNQHERFGPY